MSAPNSVDRFDSSGEFRPMPDRSAMQAESRRKNLKIGLWSVGAIALLVFSMVWNPPTGRVHSFTRASDYKAASDSGCTNSGEGCHGDESSYTDFNAYHKNAKCTTCHEYQGVGCIPCHKLTGHECQSCHDGTLKIAGDRNRITDPYPRGHYRETTHTATGTNMRAVVRASAEGKAGATCRACHARDLYASHQNVPAVKKSEYGDSVGCGECHNDARAEGLKQVQSKWKSRRCEDCHAKDSSAPMHATDVAGAVKSSGPAACGDTGAGCHDDGDVHSLHGNAPKDCSGSASKGEPRCHDLNLQAAEPTATACGSGGQDACHPSYENDRSSHRKDRKVHAVVNSSLSSDRRYGDTPCSDCHDMKADGTSLIDEHERPNGSIASAADGTCRACHNASDATAATVADGWKERSAADACEACHDPARLDARHDASADKHEGTALTPAGTPSNNACKATGCHSTLDLRELHQATGCTTTGCHSNTGDIRGLNRTTCGGSNSARACHAGVHSNAEGLHTAGNLQAVAIYRDTASGNNVACSLCHGMRLVAEHSRPNSVLAGGVGTICARCHDASAGVRAVVAGRWLARSTTGACTACHRISNGVSAPHAVIADVHFAAELDSTGTAEPRYCTAAGCHPSNDVRIVHKRKGCTIQLCHQPSGDIRGAGTLRCGGTGSQSCHAGFSRTSHGQDHSADLTGTVNDVSYSTATNLGCFGCHYRTLTAEHSRALQNGSMDGGGASACRVCHAGPVSADNGAYSDLPAVRAAITNGDRRCVACHSGGDTDGAVAVASPHRNISTDASQPVGAVWSDPLDDWKAALNSATGGGHNALSAAIVGAARDKSFPVTEFELGESTYNWVLPPNSGTTAWLRTRALDESETSGLPVKMFPSATTTAGIQGLMVTCEDCHVMGDAVGPQGAAVEISIDPAYSQTEYANPTPGTYQFDPFNVDDRTSNNPSGYKPVICVKCHLVYARSRPGTTAVSVGGFSYHSTHASRHKEACITCHVRIPHAWKRPRLLPRTVVAEGVAPDAFPYVPANFKGLTGMRLTNFTSVGMVTRATCVTGGCYSSYYASQNPPVTRNESVTEHPKQSNLPTSAAYWP